MAAPNRMNFRKSCKGGGSFVIFNPKIHVADFGILEFWDFGLFEREIDKKKSNFRVQGMFFSTIVLILTDIN